MEIKPWRTFYTKKQLLKVLEEWGVSEPIPTKGKVLYISFPPREGVLRNLATITWSTNKSTYDKRLYECILSKG